MIYLVINKNAIAEECVYLVDGGAEMIEYGTGQVLSGEAVAIKIVEYLADVLQRESGDTSGIPEMLDLEIVAILNCTTESVLFPPSSNVHVVDN